jgi:SLA1 homology domain 1, SHD1
MVYAVILIAAAIVLHGLFGAMGRKSSSLRRWKNAESRDVQRPNDARAKFCMANLGRQITITYHNKVRTIVPLRVFTKVGYRKTYVLAKERWRTKTFNIDDMTLGADRSSNKRLDVLIVMILTGSFASLFVYFSQNLTRHAPPSNDRAAKSALDSSSPVSVPLPVPTPAMKPTPVYRTWTDSTGKFKTEAVFIQRTGESLTLRKRDGKEITLAVSKLSDEDQMWIREHGKQAGKLP